MSYRYDDPGAKRRTNRSALVCFVVCLVLSLGYVVDTLVTLRARAGRLRAALDADGDGVVTKDEWRAGLESPELRALLRPEPGSADEGHASSTHARLATELADLRAGAANGLRGMMAGIRAPAALSPSAYASAALSSSAYALPEDRCLPDEGATCREVCIDLHWLGKLHPPSQITESCFRVAKKPNAKDKPAYIQPEGTEIDKDGPTAGEACCDLGGGRIIAVRESPRLIADAVDASFVPDECQRFVPRSFSSIDELTVAGKGEQHGMQGGKWTACTHLKKYGMNFAAFHARHIAYGLRPRTVLEFGCGLGTTSDFLARHIPGGAHVVCVEPEVMLGEVFAHPARAAPARPVQIAMNSFEPAAAPCVDALYRRRKYELVITLEVAEHLAPSQLEPLADLLAAATGKYLVFSAARPKQKGTGHVEGSMKPCAWWRARFEERGLVYLHGITERLRFSAKPEREYDIGTNWNQIVMGTPGTPDRSDLPPEIADCDIYPHKWCPHDGPQARTAAERRRSEWLNGQAMALWPELHVIWRKIKLNKLRCG
mmetsp:Transcript_17284/g.53971  ORF Transcript_17284/g.53971 Transcript_17284/m.53971 type:complete len:544 (-) Transcript_17284:39-1670(-)